MERQRINFCDELRGFAAMIVMLSHFTIGFNALHGYLYNPANSADIFPSWFLKLLPIDGAFGVAIFFLISGFVIPFSLEKKTAFTFLQARVIRIYPVYIVCALISFLVGVGSYGFELQSIIVFLKSITLFRDWLGGPAIDGVLWSLEIEVKFYLYMALMFPIARRKPVIVIAIPLVVILVFACLLNINPIYPMQSMVAGYHSMVNVILYNLGYLSYMNIGFIVYLYHTNFFNKILSLFLVLVSLIVFLIFISKRHTGNHLVIEIYCFALMVFLFFYKYGAKFKSIFSGFFAKISYPLYAVHSSLGFFLLSVLIFKYNINALLSLGLVIILILYIAYLIHIYVELPSIKKSASLHRDASSSLENPVGHPNSIGTMIC